MTRYRTERQKGGRAGRPQKLPPVCREGVGTCKVVEEMERGGTGVQT